MHTMDNELFFGIRLKKTGEMLSSQVAQILSDKKIEFEPRGIYLLIVLKEKEQASIKGNCSNSWDDTSCNCSNGKFSKKYWVDSAK